MYLSILLSGLPRYSPLLFSLIHRRSLTTPRASPSTTDYRLLNLTYQIMIMDRPRWSTGRSSFAPTRREIALVCSLSALFLVVFQFDLAGNSWSVAKSSANGLRNKIQISEGSSILGGHSKDDDGLYDFDYYDDDGLPASPEKSGRRPHREFSSHVKPHGELSHTAADSVVADTATEWTNGNVPETSILAHAPGKLDRIFFLGVDANVHYCRMDHL